MRIRRHPKASISEASTLVWSRIEAKIDAITCHVAWFLIAVGDRQRALISRRKPGPYRESWLIRPRRRHTPPDRWVLSVLREPAKAATTQPARR